MTRQVNLIAGQPQEFYEVSDFFRLLSAVDPLTVEFYNQGREVSEAVGISKGYAEKFDRGTFDRVRLVSATTQAVQFVTRLGNVVQYDAAPIGDTAIVSSVPLALDAGTLAALESIDLNAATINQLNRPLQVAGWSNLATVVANTAIAVFNPGSNVNGAIIWTAESIDSLATISPQAFVAKNGAPATVFDGLVICQTLPYAMATSNTLHASQLANPVRIAAGLGVYFISSTAGSAGGARSCNYVLL